MNGLSALSVVALLAILFWLAHWFDKSQLTAHICHMEGGQIVLVDGYEKSVLTENGFVLQCEEKSMTRQDFYTARKTLGLKK